MIKGLAKHSTEISTGFSTQFRIGLGQLLVRSERSACKLKMETPPDHQRALPTLRLRGHEPDVSPSPVSHPRCPEGKGVLRPMRHFPHHSDRDRGLVRVRPPLPPRAGISRRPA